MGTTGYPRTGEDPMKKIIIVAILAIAALAGAATVLRFRSES